MKNELVIGGQETIVQSSRVREDLANSTAGQLDKTSAARQGNSPLASSQQTSYYSGTGSRCPRCSEPIISSLRVEGVWYSLCAREQLGFAPGSDKGIPTRDLIRGII